MSDGVSLPGGSITENLIDGLVQVEITLPQSETVARWKFPCVTEIACNIPQPPVTDLVGSIIISSVGLGFILILLICIKICHYKATRNDELRVRNSLKIVICIR